MAKVEPKKIPCPDCGLEFTVKGLPGHRAFKHNKGAPSVAEPKPGAKAQPSSSSAPTTGEPGTDAKREGLFGGW